MYWFSSKNVSSKFNLLLCAKKILHKVINVIYLPKKFDINVSSISIKPT